MTREQAIERVRKLRALATSNTNANEAKAARESAKKIAKEHSLTEDDIEPKTAPDTALAFDRLVAAIANEPWLSRTIITHVLTKPELGQAVDIYSKAIKPEQKVKMYEFFEKAVTVGIAVLGADTPTGRTLKRIYETSKTPTKAKK